MISKEKEDVKTGWEEVEEWLNRKKTGGNRLKER